MNKKFINDIVSDLSVNKVNSIKKAFQMTRSLFIQMYIWPNAKHQEIKIDRKIRALEHMGRHIEAAQLCEETGNYIGAVWNYIHANDFDKATNLMKKYADSYNAPYFFKDYVDRISTLRNQGSRV